MLRAFGVMASAPVMIRFVRRSKKATKISLPEGLMMVQKWVILRGSLVLIVLQGSRDQKVTVGRFLDNNKDCMKSLGLNVRSTTMYKRSVIEITSRYLLSPAKGGGIDILPG